MERKVSVYFVSQIIGVISANHMLLVTNGRSSLLRTDSVLIVPHPDIEAATAAAVGASSVERNTTQVCAPRIEIWK